MSVTLIETHISWVFLTGAFAFKIKKPLKLPFLDFTSLEQRRHFCQEELRLNRRFAPELYVEVIPIGGTTANPVLGAQPAIEYAVKMREFADDARLDRRLDAEAVAATDILEFAELMGAFHVKLQPASADSAFGSSRAVQGIVVKNLNETADVAPGRLGLDSPVRHHLLNRGRELKGVLRQRKRAGAIRECHGDLHLENLVYWHNKILPFDALEFDPALRWIDVVDEMAFFAMDLMAHGRTAFAYIFMNRYLEITGDYVGLSVLHYYMIHRALVRAKVLAIKANQIDREQYEVTTDPYLVLAQQLIQSQHPTLIITRGLSGSGKTTLTERLIPKLPALRVRSDIERKRLAGLAEQQRSHSGVGSGIYASGRSEATYSELARAAETGLRAGFSMIVDAAFLRAYQRRHFMDLARRVSAEFLILDCQASVESLRQRIATREAQGSDASEASIDVLDYQLTISEELTPTERARAMCIDTEVLEATDSDLERLHALISRASPGS